jgi:hypothetical protein
MTANDSQDAATSWDALPIDSWLDGPAGEYTDTGDRHFRSALDGALISRLVIEP